MRPGHIQVFDGLRITTEHMNHLQGSFHSAIEDLRGILGLGRVYHGFEVVAGEGHSVDVMPGLAFDYEGNRIVSDKPKTVDVAFTDEGKPKLVVCIQYEQVEQGKVEERPTMIFDHCSVLLREELPQPEENLISVAELIKRENGDTKFDIVSLLDTEEVSEPETIEEDVLEPAGEFVKHESETAEDTVLPEEEVLADELVGEESGYPEDAAISGERETEETAGYSIEGYPNGRRSGVHIQQGVIRLLPEQGKPRDLRGILLEPLRELLTRGEKSSDSGLKIPLAEKETALKYYALSLSFSTIISASFESAGTVPSSEGEPLNAASLHTGALTFQATSQGEVLCADNEVSQFGVSTIQQYRKGRQGLLWQTSDITETGIAHIPFAVMFRQQGARSPEDLHQILEHLQLRVEVNKKNDNVMKTTCKLLWKGGIIEEFMKKMERKKYNMHWEVACAWKSLGECKAITP